MRYSGTYVKPHVEYSSIYDSRCGHQSSTKTKKQRCRMLPYMIENFKVNDPERIDRVYLFIHDNELVNKQIKNVIQTKMKLLVHPEYPMVMIVNNKDSQMSITHKSIKNTQNMDVRLEILLEYMDKMKQPRFKTVLIPIGIYPQDPSTFTKTVDKFENIKVELVEDRTMLHKEMLFSSDPLPLDRFVEMYTEVNGRRVQNFRNGKYGSTVRSLFFID